MWAQASTERWGTLETMSLTKGQKFLPKGEEVGGRRRRRELSLCHFSLLGPLCFRGGSLFQGVLNESCVGERVSGASFVTRQAGLCRVFRGELSRHRGHAYQGAMGPAWESEPRGRLSRDQASHSSSDPWGLAPAQAA